MAKLSDSNVEFFNSQSSFGSSSVLSNSRAIDLADQLIDESQTIFHSLQQKLLPRDDLVEWDEVNHIIHRAKILSRQTIPQNILYLERDPEIKQQKISQVTKQKHKLTELLTTYDAYLSAHIQYKKLYEIYGLNNAMNFSKKPPMNIQLQTEVVEIIDNSQSRHNRSANVGTPLSLRQNKMNRQREVQQLHEEINRLRNRQRNLIRQKQDSEVKIKAEAEERINKLLKLFRTNKEEYNLQNLKIQNEKTKEELFQQYETTLKLNNEVSQLQTQLQDLQQYCQMLQEDLHKHQREYEINLSESSPINRSIYSQNEGAETNDSKKLKKIIENLKYQQKLLKVELKKQREILYKRKSQQEKLKSEEISQLKKQLQTKTQENKTIVMRLDETKIENIRLSQRIKNLEKQLALSHNSKLENSPHLDISRVSMKSEESMIGKPNKYHIQSYTGEGNQGYPYYELLKKQFRIRFRRSCLRSKQLLYKASGLQVGSISEFQLPNIIKINLHLSNFGDQQAIKNLSLKITNSKNNKIIIPQISKYQTLRPNEQIKYPISISIKYYPIGGTILLCSYDYYDKTEQIRIILPCHIFKMFTIKPRDGEFHNPIRKSVIVERKIGTSIKSIAEYFSGACIRSNSIEAAFYHEHTQTKLWLDIIEKRSPEFEIRGQLRSGQQGILDYTIKSLAYLLSKE